MTRETTVTGVASAVRRYGVALLSVAAALALTRALWPWVAPHLTPLFLAAVGRARGEEERGLSIARHIVEAHGGTVEAERVLDCAASPS